MSSSNIADVLASNASYSSTYTNPGGLVLPSKRKFALITCMDPRLDVSAAFGIELGHAPIIRNAGGSVKGAIRDLAISGLLGGTKEILVVKHTGKSELLVHRRAFRFLVVTLRNFEP
jgi:carbonic anhydrase